MGKGKAGLFAIIDYAIASEGDGGIRSLDAESRVGRDMGGPFLNVKYLNDDNEWESYTIFPERIN